MRVSLNRQHFLVWGRIGAWWATIIVMALIFGPHARADELLFGIVGLPLMVIVPYAVGPFVVSYAKTLFPSSPRWRRRRIRTGHGRLGQFYGQIRSNYLGFRDSSCQLRRDN
jgi:hypothetical protein